MIRDRAIARRYAVALFGAARKAGVAEEVLTDLQAVEALAKADRAFQQFLDAPDVLTEHKLAAVETVFQGRVHELVSRLLVLMLQKKRIQHFPFVHGEYRGLVEEELGVARARVTTAVPLDPAVIDGLVRQFERISGKKIRLETRVDPAVIGGMVVIVGDQILDGSLRHRLADLRDQLLGARVH